MVTLSNTIIDETQTDQLIYSPDLDAFLQISTVSPTVIQSNADSVNAQIAVLQTQLATFKSSTDARQTAISSGPVGIALQGGKGQVIAS